MKTKLALLLLQFNHGVEIGAYLAYKGHYTRTKDINIKRISRDELHHKLMIKWVLRNYNKTTSRIIDSIFKIIGLIILHLCKVSPKFLLNMVAKSLEIFAVFSYNYISTLLPNFKTELIEMSLKEDEHKKYFDNI